jgi:hypothetical protein
VDRPYWARAAVLTACSLVNSVAGRAERAVFGRALARTAAPPPVFVLGHWRSGTTHLHNLLGVDRQFAFPNFYQVLCPHAFLTTEALAARLVSLLLPERRLMDNVREDIHMPHEDEFALCALAPYSPYLSMVFPRREADYDRYLTFRGVSREVVEAWKATFLGFVKKLTWKYGRPLVLKSPAHTGRIPLLLELFPDARFVHIHRNPYAVFQSTRHLHEKASPAFSLQRPQWGDLDERIIRRYRVMYDAFFADRLLIPAGHYHEVGFEDLEKDPLG